MIWILLISVLHWCSASASYFALGTGLTNFDYSENLTPPSKSNETGYFASFHGKMVWGGTSSGAPPTGLVISATVDISPLSNLRYDGSTLSTGSSSSTPVTTTNVHFFGFTEVNFGWGLNLLSGNVNVTPYFGIGYRAWNRYLTYGTGYRELYTWSYQTIGLRGEIFRAGNTSIDLDLSLRPMTSGKMKIVFSEFVTTGQDSEVTLGNRPGYKISADLQSDFYSTWRIYAQLFYERSEIAQSNIVYNGTPISGGGVLGYIYEPESRTFQYGLKMSLGKSF